MSLQKNLSTVAGCLSCLALGAALVIALRLPLQAATAAPDPQAAFTTVNANRPINFNRDVRPILSDRCFSCHGPDENKRQSGLRLDKRENAFNPLPKHVNKRAFVPGKPEQSYAYQRMMSPDPQEVMPPSTSHLTLNEKEKDIVRRWIEQGAQWSEHWAYVKPARAQPPKVSDETWPRNAIDRFVMARLDEEQLTPSSEADKRTLIRRVSLDLTGIPPTPEQVDSFVSDASPDAYEKVVDRLLASPHYGEQMASQWLDYARYADSHGFQSDPERHMSLWRDWVINAYNKNMPFDQFATEQIAGDLLPNATLDQQIATGFNRNHRHNSEGGIIAEEWRIENVIDRTSTTSAVFLGLTMECCRCHDHKYEPITQKEFYQFSAFFNSIDETGGIRDRENTDSGINAKPILQLPTPQQKAQREKLEAVIADVTKQRDELKKTVPAVQAAWLADGGKVVDPAGIIANFPLDGAIDGRDADGKPIHATVMGAAPAYVAGKTGKGVAFDGRATSTLAADDVVHFERDEARTLGAWVKFRGPGSIFGRIDPMPVGRGFDLYADDDRLTLHLEHHWDDNVIKVRAKTGLPKDKWVHVMATYDGSSKAAGVKLYVDGKAVVTETLNDTLTDSIVSKAPFRIGTRGPADHFSGDVADVRVYGRALESWEVASLALKLDVTEALAVPAAKRTVVQKKLLTSFVELTHPPLAKLADQVTSVQRSLDDLDLAIPNTQVMRELPKPRDTFILLRGQYDKPGDKVQPGTPAILPPMPADAPKNRLGLARWIVDPQNPLTSRVLVNRLWEKFFGIGLVKTSENIGVQAEWPSNPELLDYLATEMLSLKWDLKAFQKELVMSAAYRQSSNMTPQLIERDPENRLLAHGPRFRLNAEVIRDQVLEVSGLLNEKLGGPSVRPYEPLTLWDGNLFGNLGKYVPDKGDSLYRRSIYTFLKRTAAPPNLTVFDMPNREYCVIRRSRTNTPLQALDLLNDPTYVEASRVLAERIMKAGGSTPADRIAFAFRRATCRPPTEEESKVLLSGFDRQLAEFKRDPKAAKKLIAVGDSKHDPALDASEVAAYTMTCRVILNLDEMITRQ